MSLTPTQKKKIRAAITDYCIRAEAARLNRGYSQRRPGLGYGLEPEHVQIDDCSMFDSKVIYWAGHKTKILLPDPLGYGFSGYGNTETMQEHLKHAAPIDKYLVGDIALWGPNSWDTHHTAICRKAGTRKTAIFTSHGHQSSRFSADAPEPVTLATFPQHLIGVYRLPELR